ncbi:uncharacterized protein LOC135216025 isoform X2 [Macrobrachium nipponense]|uniref:uncharacterized protein LOC135216025 isoform X2 n=1 Tax=Macrobrachium nipponense TaxID=159736 RepID=UPI0030C8A109
MAGIKLILAAVTLAMAVSVNSEPLGRLARRAVLLDENFVPESYGDSLGVPSAPLDNSDAPRFPWAPSTLARSRRSPGYGGPPIWVNTFAMTDYHGNFKWGVKHNVGHGHH